MKPIEQQIAEQATGCRQHGTLGQYYAGPINRKGRVSSEGNELTTKQAYDFLREGGAVSVPNAGAGSYREFFKSLGLEVEVVEQSSSAGDWTFAVKDGDEGDWYVASQSNRYPRHGFDYCVDFNRPFFSYAQLLNHANI